MAGTAPISLTGIFGADSDEEEEVANETSTNFCNEKDIQRITLAGVQIQVCQMSWHQANANQVWPGTYALADHILSVREGPLSRYEGHNILELGAATGALSIALIKAGDFRTVTSDIDDGGDVLNNVKENFERNGLQPCEHITHTWGDGWPTSVGTLGLKYIIASDILLYVKAYPGLVQTLQEIFDREPDLIEFLMSWKRRIKESSIFFRLMEEGGFRCHVHGKGLYSFYRASKMDDYLRRLESAADSVENNGYPEKL